METVASALAASAGHPRAVPWTLRYPSGFAVVSAIRTYVLFAPPTLEAARVVMARVHNGLLLLGSAGVAIEAPLPSDRLAGLLDPYRSFHKVPIVFGPHAHAPVAGDVPSADSAVLPAPGPGLAVGLDIGGTGMKACALRGRTLVRTAAAPTWPDGQRGIESLIARARSLLEQVAERDPVGSLGIGLAAPMGVGGRVRELSAVLQDRVGDLRAFDGFAERVAWGLVDGPVAIFNDLANLGRFLSAEGLRRAVRVQIGTSFGGCWIDANGDVNAVEMGRVVVDVGPTAVAHPYLPISGAMRGYLSNIGIANFLEPQVGHAVDPRTAGHLLRGLLDAGDPAGDRAITWMAEALAAVIEEIHALLPGVVKVEVGGSMLQGPAGRRLEAVAQPRTAVPMTVAARPGHDGAVAAAMAPRIVAPLRGHKRVE